MSPGATNLYLFGAIPLLVLSGLLAWALPGDAAATLITLHRVVASSLIVVLAWKLGIARRSVARRVRAGQASSLLVGSLTGVALLVVLGIGLAWTIGLISFDRPFAYSLLNIHVFIGVALVPLVVAHAAPRRVRVPPGRREWLRAGAVLAGGVVLAAALDRVDATRRATGSRVATGDVPITSWTFDSVPELDPAAWQLDITGPAARSMSLAQLLAMPRVEQDVTLDCTSGWASTRRWTGASLAQIAGATERRVRVTSVTGHTATFAPDEVASLVLATHLGGVPLTSEHGAPARLVAPTHRGFMWIKWVARVEVL